MQHAEQLQAVMKSKFSSSNDSGIKIGFKLSDGSKTEYVLKQNSTVKVYRISIAIQHDIIILTIFLCGPDNRICTSLLLSVISSPDSTPKKEGLVTFERFLGSCKLSIFTFAKANQIAAPQFSCDLASGHAATIVQCQLVV